MFRIMLAAACVLFASCAANASDDALNGAFRLTMQTHQYGATDAIVSFERQGDAIVGQSSNAAGEQVRAMIADRAIAAQGDAALVTLRLNSQPNGAYSGRVIGPGFDDPVTLSLTNGALTGEIASGPLQGALQGAPYLGGDAPLRDYPAVITAMDQTLPAMMFNPALMQTPAFTAYRVALGEVAAHARDDIDLLFAAHLGWSNATFSHFYLTRESRADIIADIDSNTNRPSAELHFDGDIAIMRVNTFLGENAIAQIQDAIAETNARNARALIVDLRATPGGSLAAKNLIEGLIPAPMPMGVFTANAWWRSHDAAPSAEELAGFPSTTFDDPEAAFQTLIRDGVLPVESRPAAVRYAGPVFVLIDHETVSVAELAAAALGGSRRATLVGERTAGELLSADTVPLAEGFLMLTPLADYADARLGRIEAVGVAPHVATSSADALDRALALARGS